MSYLICTFPINRSQHAQQIQTIHRQHTWRTTRTHDIHPDRYKLRFYNLLFAYSFASTPPAPHLSSPSYFSLPLSAVSLFLSQGECGKRVCMIAVDFSVTSIRIIVPCALGFSYCVACLVCAQTRVIPQLSVLVKVGHYTSLPPESALPGLHFRLFFFGVCGDIYVD